MALDLSVNPYLDDFDGTKNYQRILFKPGIGVQTRELTQLQTQLQTQISRFGNHVFVNGSTVLNSERFFDSDLISIKHTGAVDSIGIVGKTIKGQTSGALGLVKAYDAVSRKLIIKVTSGDKILSTENLTYLDDIGSTVEVAIDQTTAFGEALIFSVNSGIIFALDNFVYNTAQSIILNSSTNKSSHSVGFKVKEDIISSDEDQTLLDNAQGSPNFAAPGADRYSIDLELVSYDLGSINENFIEIARIKDGELVYVQQRTLYSELEKEFARRTYDESGNYTVRPFSLSFEDHIAKVVVKPTIISGSISGFTILENSDLFTSIPTVTVTGNGSGAICSAIIDNVVTSPTYQKLIGITISNGGAGYSPEETYVKIGGDKNKFSAKLESGKAYVKGYEFETINSSYLTIDKARTLEFADNIDSQVFYGNFLYVNTLSGLFNPDTFATIELHSVTKNLATNSTLLGTAKIRFLDYVSGTIGSTAIYKFYLFSVTMNPSQLFANVESLVIRSGSTVIAGANVDNLSKAGGVTSGDVSLSGSDAVSLVFPLNNIYVKSLRDTQGTPQNDYTFKRTFTNVGFSSGAASIGTNSNLELFVGGVGSYNAIQIAANYHFVVTSVTSSSFTVGQIVTPTSITGSANGQNINILFSGAGSFTAAITASINANTQTEKLKSLQPYFTRIISNPNTTVGNFDSLQTSDLYRVAGIYNTGNTNPAGLVTVNPTTGQVTSWGGVAATNVTANYIVDNGQRDDIYDHARIVLNGPAPLSTNYIVVIYDYFTHTNGGFASVDSYSGLDYADIPFYTSPASGKRVSLADCVDFRPRRIDGGTGFSNIQLPDPDVQFSSDYSYYVGRIDKIVANSSKSFSVKTGNPSSTPKVPSEEQDGMTLYILEIPPYTESLTDVSVKFIENKRYTMKDIGSLEKRIDNLEYYTQLSLLEKQAKDESVVDSTNFEKFKNGFFVDSFNTNESLSNTEDTSAWSKQIWGWWNNREGAVSTWNKSSSRVYSSSVGDSLNIDYAIAIDPLNSEMRAEALTSFGEFKFSSGINSVKTGDTVTLGYTEKTIINNPVASKSVNINPYNVIAFNGGLKLNPSSDTWVETTKLPAVTKIIDVKLPDLPTRTDTIVTSVSSKGKLFHETSRSTRIDTNVIGQKTSSLGSSVIDVQYIPFARARTIIGIGNKFKPKTRHYAFMEGIPLSSQTRPLTLLEVDSQTGSLFSGATEEFVQFRTGSVTGPVVGSANVAIYSPPKTTNSSRRLLTVFNVVGTIPTNCFVTSTGKSARVLLINTYALGAPIVSDEYGLIGFEFNLPSNTIRTGLRNFRLIDNIDNQESGSQSTGQSTYFAQGILQTKQETLLTTRSVQQQKVITIVGFRNDPLAQTISVDPRFYPNGYHVSSVDVFFKSKSTTVPVTLELTKTVNGFPESVVTSIPFAISTKMPDEIAISADGSVATKFKLPSLVHLVPGEYAIVLKSNSDEYEVFVGEMGRTDLITNQIISKQPDTGVLFKSQNASTWTAFQEEDLKFNLNIAQFNTSGTAEFSINSLDEFKYTTLHLNTSTVVPSDTKLIWSYKGVNVGTPDFNDVAFMPISTGVDINLFQVKKALAAGSIVIKAELSTTNPNVSPVIDIEGLGAILINNNINFTDISVTDMEETASGGNAKARYISKPVTLADGFDSSNLVVTLDAYNPAITDVRVYYKISPTESSEPFSNNVWKRMELKTPVPKSTSEIDFREYKFYPKLSFGNFGIPLNNPISPRFNTFAIKIVLVSQNESISPKVRDLRCIALDS